MKELLKQYSAYNLWAHQRIIDVILSLPEETCTVELPSSFNSLHKTILHMWDAESAWWQRMKMQERVIKPSENFSGNTKEVTQGLLQQSRQWEEWVSSASDLSLDHVFQYYTNKTEHVKMPVWQMLLHVFNHGTYHRGQLINMLRQSGQEKLPSTDFSFYTRNRK
jgi:uncharacterized damage-inducible protein DinB